jgi:L-erythro-3,5-diaminohexanoate dehydrogenase
LGTVEEVGKGVVGKGFQVGERITTLVSLSLTPLHLEAIESVDLANEQLRVQGHGILFESGIAHRMPADIPEPLALAVFDVCGAPALVSQLVHVGETVVILGAGKAGVLAAAAARKKIGKGGHIFLLEKNEGAVAQARTLPFIDDVFVADLTDPHATRELVSQSTSAKMADLVVNCVNVAKTEMSAILSAKRSGTVIFFSMATNFQAAVLGAEGIGHETKLIMGNGYTPGHADLSLNLLREHESLKGWFEKRFQK